MLLLKIGQFVDTTRMLEQISVFFSQSDTLVSNNAYVWRALRFCFGYNRSNSARLKDNTENVVIIYRNFFILEHGVTVSRERTLHEEKNLQSV